ncbi:unnamed protein product [Bursaphelenchus okinawaensis]|uniref:Peptidase C1A papain C-terminal domain-containing protein n=1 Tax=Bursaphelenchus okinawaensis TaxID=465554 RepID=A0A811LQ35_9BILA|nr:unnamed protein product [Bursaphelenchus okinawaensis]CAG9125970.1 unnamed protein product [Bursaphelenchus okinawaensis]
MLLLLFLAVGLVHGFGSSESSESAESDFVLDKASFRIQDYVKDTLPKAAQFLKGQKLVDYVNRRQNLWKAKLHPKLESYDEGVRYGLMGVNHVKNSVKAKKNLAESRFMDMEIPKQFDARTNWPNCPSIRAIRDQSSCGSCWAFGAVEAISDRICIASNGQLKPLISAADLLSCCKECGYGCNGGEPYQAWEFWVSDGLVTGSDYDTHVGCRTYPFPPCEHHSNHTERPQCKKELYPTPKCIKHCDDNRKSYAEDKYYGEKAYAVDSNVEAIQKELMAHGPLEVSFEVYTDFLTYAGGVYVHQGGHLGGGHAVRLVGWGEENGIPYWTIANSWNTDWGEGGFFRILRGADECGIESGVVGGTAKLNRNRTKMTKNYDIY